MSAGSSPPPFRIETIDHIVLRAIDMARQKFFYCEVLGCTLEREQPEIGLVQLRAGAALIDLVDVNGRLGAPADVLPSHATRNLDHLCLRITPFDEPRLRAHLASHGVVLGASAPRYGAQGIGPSLYLEDPEGNTVELKAKAGMA
jgi:catechol 2,3-dioxygenase-like lactoylglutathione lyase family enzyme